MSWTPLIAGLWLLAPPEPREEQGMVELGVAAEVVYPPARRTPLRHPTYGAAISGSIYGAGRFKAMVGVGFDHVVYAWLGDPDEGEPFGGSEPASYRGQLFRLTPQFRVGLENEVAYGYVGASPGYAVRTAALECVQAPCSAERAVEHGLTMGLSLGAMFHPSQKVGFVLGGEVGLDWSYFPAGHRALAPWNQAMSARLIVGWSF